MGQVIPVVITAAKRSSEVQQRMLRSVLAAGFGMVLVSAEPDTDVDAMRAIAPDAEYLVHSEKRGQWRNFIEVLRLGVRTEAQYFITAEDDVLFCRQLGAFLTQLRWPAADCGCVQLYSSERYLKRLNWRSGLFRLSDVHAQDMLGACALLFRRDAAKELIQWAERRGWRGETAAVIERMDDKKGADTFVGEVLSFLRFSIWAFVPTLVEHIGDQSTLGHNMTATPNRRSCQFPGVDADLFEIFKEVIH